MKPKRGPVIVYAGLTDPEYGPDPGGIVVEDPEASEERAPASAARRPVQRISVDYRARDATFVVRVSTPVVAQSKLCKRVELHEVHCADRALSEASDVYVYPGHGDSRVRIGAGSAGFNYIDAMEGDDHLRASSNPRATSQLWGGFDGDDVLIGTPGDDEIDDGRGDDILRGRGGSDDLDITNGSDLVKGGPGDDRISVLNVSNRVPDRIYAGAGNDEISAANRHRDRLLDCGPGERDEAFLDSSPRDRARNCEVVKRAPARERGVTQGDG